MYNAHCTIAIPFFVIFCRVFEIFTGPAHDYWQHLMYFGNTPSRGVTYVLTDIVSAENSGKERPCTAACRSFSECTATAAASVSPVTPPRRSQESQAETFNCE